VSPKDTSLEKRAAGALDPTSGWTLCDA
jgi:hypothetical protein